MPIKPKPTALRKLQGNPSKRPFNPDEPQLPAATEAFDEVPPAIADDPVAKSEWQRLAPILRQARIVTDADRNALLGACQQWSVYQHALTQSPADRRVLRSKNDHPIPNPYLQIAHKALTHCERLWEALGLTPSARSRVVSARASGGDGDPFAEFDEPAIPRVTKGPTLSRYVTKDPRPS
jgi:P27 family predicted phage terminase small subunit